MCAYVCVRVCVCVCVCMCVCVYRDGPRGVKGCNTISEVCKDIVQSEGE